MGLAATPISAVNAEAPLGEVEVSVPAEAGVAIVAQDFPDIQIRVGRALDLEGRPVYAGHSRFSDTAAVATFSTSRPRVGNVAGPRATSMAMTTGMPLARSALTSGFGMRADPLLGGHRMHSGIDLAAPAGSPIIATSDGIVSQAGWRGGYGLFVALEHGGGLQTRYGHMSGLAVATGQAVHKGDIIGYVGSTGRSTGPHLHYEIRVNGAAVRPLLRSPGRGDNANPIR